jgi:hypothetical protein
MLTKLYRKVVPLSFRNFIYDLFLGTVLTFVRNFKENTKSKFIFCFKWLLPKTELNQAYAFMGQHGLVSYPGKYMLSYLKKDVVFDFDSALGLSYVLHNSKKLYFPSSFSKEKVIFEYKRLLTEQDEHSAHRYVRKYEDLKGFTLFDIGSAEGIFSLDVIEYIDHVHLFECEEMWLAPLSATFLPWKDKVTLVKKYVGNQSDDNFVTIDEYLKEKPKSHLFLKMDIEGAEMLALKGSMETLNMGNNIRLAVCTYHRKTDPEQIYNLLTSSGFTCEFSEGYIFWNRRLSKAVIRCYK